jgi:hypothetical protein
MKKFLLLILTILLCGASLTALAAKRDQDTTPAPDNRPTVSVLYGITNELDFSDAIYKQVLQDLGQSLPVKTYDWSLGARYIQQLAHMGIVDGAGADLSDILAAYEYSGYDYCLCYDVEPFRTAAGKKWTPSHQDLTVQVGFRIIDVQHGKYLANEQLLEKITNASDGRRVNQGAVLKMFQHLDQKAVATLAAKLPKTKM